MYDAAKNLKTAFEPLDDSIVLGFLTWSWPNLNAYSNHGPTFQYRNIWSLSILIYTSWLKKRIRSGSICLNEASSHDLARANYDYIIHLTVSSLIRITKDDRLLPCSNIYVILWTMNVESITTENDDTQRMLYND